MFRLSFIVIKIPLSFGSSQQWETLSSHPRKSYLRSSFLHSSPFSSINNALMNFSFLCSRQPTDRKESWSTKSTVSQSTVHIVVLQRFLPCSRFVLSCTSSGRVEEKNETSKNLILKSLHFYRFPFIAPLDILYRTWPLKANRLLML